MDLRAQAWCCPDCHAVILIPDPELAGNEATNREYQEKLAAHHDGRCPAAGLELTAPPKREL